MGDRPSEKRIKKAFYKITDGDEYMDEKDFRKLCSKFFQTVTKKESDELFNTLDKNQDSRLSFEEVSALFNKAWKPQDVIQQEFMRDIKLCRTCEGPMTRDEIKGISQRGNDSEEMKTS